MNLKETLRQLASENVGKPLIVSKQGLALHFGISERKVERVLSELRKERIAFLPTHIMSGQYCLYTEGYNDELLEAYQRYNISQMRTMYRDNVQPYRHIIKDLNLINEIGQLKMWDL